MFKALIIHSIHFSRTTKINSYSSRLVHSPFIVFRAMFHQDRLTEHHTKINKRLLVALYLLKIFHFDNMFTISQVISSLSICSIDPFRNNE